MGKSEATDLLAIRQAIRELQDRVRWLEENLANLKEGVSELETLLSAHLNQEKSE